MAAPDTMRGDATLDFNHLKRGSTYLATTPGGTAVGEYLGMEASYGDRAILLRSRTGTASICLFDVTSIELLAA